MGLGVAWASERPPEERLWDRRITQLLAARRAGVNLTAAAAALFAAAPPPSAAAAVPGRGRAISPPPPSASVSSLAVVAVATAGRGRADAAPSPSSAVAVGGASGLDREVELWLEEQLVLLQSRSLSSLRVAQLRALGIEPPRMDWNA